ASSSGETLPPAAAMLPPGRVRVSWPPAAPEGAVLRSAPPVSNPALGSVVAGWVPPAGLDHSAAVPGGLVAEHAEQVAEPGVGDGTVQATLAGAACGHHVLYRKGLDPDHRVGLSQAGGELVQPVGAQVRYPGVGRADLALGARPACRGFPPGPGVLGPGAVLASCRALQCPQPALGLLQLSRRGQPLQFGTSRSGHDD